MEKLTPLSDYISEVVKNKNLTNDEALHLIVNYTNFIKQPLTLGMFVPCDLDGNVLEEPEWWYRYCNGATPFMNSDEIRPCQEYKKAKDRLLFDGFEIVKWNHSEESYSVRKNNGADNEIQVCYYKAIPDYFVWSFDIIEQLCIKDLELTETAKNQLS